MKIFQIVVLIICFLPGLSAATNMAFVNADGVINFNAVHPAAVQMKPPKLLKSKKSLDAIFLKAQKKHGIETALIKAVVRAESNFNHKAISKRGAKGLMQIMPQNYKALDISDPFNPEQNIMGGTKYLRELLGRYDNSLPLALAAYNAGPDKVDKHGKQIPPYNETQKYVRKVIEFYRKYKNS